MSKRDPRERRRKARALKEKLNRLKGLGENAGADRDAAVRSVRAAEVAAEINRRIADTLVSHLRHRPEVFERLIALGLAERKWLDDPPTDGTELLRPLREAGKSLGAVIQENPSVLSDLRTTALELMSGGDELREAAGATSPVLVERDCVVVFTDLEEFTAFTAAEGDQAAGRLLAAHTARVGSLVRSRGGRVIKGLGDGHLLAFEAAEAAVLASLELVESAPRPLRLRAGGHAGTVMASDDDLLGHVVNVAARVTGQADGGETLMTREIRDRIQRLPDVGFGDPVDHRLRGIAEPVPICAVRRL